MALADVTAQQKMTPTRGYAQRMDALGTEGAFEILARARALEAAGREVIHLEIGEPSFATPQHVVEAGVAAIMEGETRYGAPQGMPALRAAIAESLQARRIARGPDDVVITPGSKPALFYSLMAVVEPGDEVLVPDPGFPIYPSVVRFAGGVPVTYGVGACIDVDEVAERITPRTRAIVINSPHNPTGAVASVAELERIAELALRHDLIMISDEIYSRLVFNGAECAPSIAELPGMADRTIVVDGFSKTWSMTGWRLGYGAFPSALAPKIVRLAINTHTCVPGFVQRAGLAALTGSQEHVVTVRRELRQRRDLMVAGLRDLVKLPAIVPEGAFYVLADLRGVTHSDFEFAAELLKTRGVATLPGSGFGERGAGWLRLSFASPFEKIAIALDRVARFREGLFSGNHYGAKSDKRY